MMVTKMPIRKLLLILGITLFACSVFGQDNLTDSIRILENRVQQVRSNQLNYQIEKDLLKETYASNLESINLVIALVLSVFGFLGFLGIRDIGKIKQEYLEELAELRNIKSQFEEKATEFDSKKAEIDGDLKQIIQENQQQSQKIKFIELKEKISSLMKDKKWSIALEFVNTALEIQPEDKVCLTNKGRLLFIHHQFGDAKDVFKKVYLADTTNMNACSNFVESLYFSGDLEEADKIVEENSAQLSKKMEGRFLEFLSLLKLYYEGDVTSMRDAAKSYVTYENLDETNPDLHWVFDDSLSWSYTLEDSEAKSILRKLLFYWKGSVTGRKLLEVLKIELPQNPEDDSSDETQGK